MNNQFSSDISLQQHSLYNFFKCFQFLSSISFQFYFSFVQCQVAKPNMQAELIPSQKSKTITDRLQNPSKKAKVFQRSNKSQHNNTAKLDQHSDKKYQTIRPISNQSRARKNQSARNKCNSELEYTQNQRGNIPFSRQNFRTEILRKQTTVNKELQEEIERAELAREGYKKQAISMKIKIPSRRREVISHDILHPPMNSAQRAIPKKQQSMKSESQKIEEQQYQQIAQQIQLNTLHSKVVQISNPIRQEQLMINRIQESESGVMSTPQHKKIGDNVGQIHQFDQTIQSPTLQVKVVRKLTHNNSQDSKSILRMNSIQQQALNRSTDNALADIERQSNNKQDLAVIPEGYSHIKPEQQLSKKVIQQSHVMVHTKPRQKKQQQQLSINSSKIQKNAPTQQFQKKHLLDQISVLKNAVRELRLEKIKMKADMTATIDVKPITYEARVTKNRYETVDASIPEKESGQSPGLNIFFGRIKKNRSISRKKGEEFAKSQQLSVQKALELPQPLINHNKFSNISRQNYFQPDQNLPMQRQTLKSKKTQQLKQLQQQKLQQSLRFHANLATSIELPVYGNQFRTNRISIRGTEVVAEALNKFDTGDKNFRVFVGSSSKVSSNKGGEGNNQGKRKSKRQQEQNDLEDNDSSQQCLKQIAKNQIPIKKSVDQLKTKPAQLPNINLIREGQKIELRKIQKKFSLKQTPSFPQSPLNTSNTQQIMSLIQIILPLSNLDYSSQDLTQSTLKKYKNCIMFQFKKYPSLKIVWYFNGKLYIGQWDAQKNEKSGFGKEFSKGKYYYEGCYLNNKRNGKGIIINDTFVYEGEWSNGLKQGFGKFKDTKMNIYYEGQWKKGKKNGKGHLQYLGNIYQGFFLEDLKQGFGIELFKNGDRYIGFYQKDKFQGQGKYLWYNSSFYQGDYNQGFRQGVGRWQSARQSCDTYIGDFWRDKKQGTGKYIWSNKCIYEGNFFNDLKHGMGSILYPDGKFITGVWTQGILTEAISKVMEQSREEPLDEPRFRTVRDRHLVRNFGGN